MVLQDVTNTLNPKKIKRKLNIAATVFPLPKEQRLSSEESNSSPDNSLNLERIISGKDSRNTIMIRNIPNRYNQIEFLRIIDVNYKGLYDFLYVPIDF